MGEARIRPEWDDPELSERIAQLRRDDPVYDQAWKDGLQRMADDWDQLCADKIYAEMAPLKPKPFLSQVTVETTTPKPPKPKWVRVPGTPKKTQ